jgi:hypothetical protein
VETRGDLISAKQITYSRDIRSAPLSFKYSNVKAYVVLSRDCVERGGHGLFETKREMDGGDLV